MILFDPVYHDERAVRVLLTLGKMASKNEWNGTDGKAEVSKYWKQRSDGSSKYTRYVENISNIAYSIRLFNIENEDAS